MGNQEPGIQSQLEHQASGVVGVVDFEGGAEERVVVVHFLLGLHVFQVTCQFGPFLVGLQEHGIGLLGLDELLRAVGQKS